MLAPFLTVPFFKIFLLTSSSLRIEPEVSSFTSSYWSISAFIVMLFLQTTFTKFVLERTATMIELTMPAINSGFGWCFVVELIHLEGCKKLTHEKFHNLILFSS